MYDKVNIYIDDYAEDNLETDKEWGNYAFDVVGDMIESFNKEDWDKLFEELPSKSPIWKKRLNDCLNDPTDENQQRALLDIAETNNAELFVKVIDKLLDSDITSIDNFEELYKKAEEFRPKFENNNYYRSVIDEILEKK